MALGIGNGTDAGTKTIQQAMQLMRAQFVPAVDVEVVPLAAARNRVLATNLAATIDLPPHDSAAMDGFAVRSADLSSGVPRLRLVGRAAAGHPFDGTIADGQTVRILTGAPLPNGADAVVMQETCVIEAIPSALPDGSRRAPTSGRAARTSAPDPSSSPPAAGFARRTSPWPPPWEPGN